MTITPEIIAALFTGLVSVLAAFYGFNKWIITKFLHELKPNGGSSLKDQVNRLERRVDDIYHILAEKE
jgi:hypothetical protein